MGKQGGIVRGGEATSHDNNGVKYIVKSTGQHVELEGDEVVLCDTVMKSDKFHSFTATPLDILKSLADEYGCKRGSLDEIHGGEFVICKKVVRDNTVISVAGTPPDIVSQLQLEKGCNVHWSWDLDKHDSATCSSCSEKKEDGGHVSAGTGNCFQTASDMIIAYRYGTEFQGIKIDYFGVPYVVHAEVTGLSGAAKGIKYAHGFIEDDLFVYDFSNGLTLIMPKQAYYALGKISAVHPKKYRRYSAVDFLKKLVRYGVYDAWELDCKYEAGGEVYKVSVEPYMGVIDLSARKGYLEQGGAIGSKVTHFYEPDTMMPTDATFQNGALYQTPISMYANGGDISKFTIPKSKKEAISLLTSLREYAFDKRFSEFVSEMQVDNLEAMELLLSDKVKVLASVSNGYFSACVLDYNKPAYGFDRRQCYVVKKGLELLPVPNGLWMDYWEKDHYKYFGISESAYLELSLRLRAELEQKLQLELWVEKQFWENFARFYLPKMYNDWWVSAGMKARASGSSNKYWQDKLESYFSPKVMAKGGAVVLSEKELAARWDKKKDQIMQLAGQLRSLRYNLTVDMKSDSEKDRLTALVISVMDKTGERVGNEESAEDGHFGVTGLMKKHVSVSGNTVKLNYIGKSGVEQEKSFSDELISSVLKKAIKESPSEFIFTTKDGFKIKNDKVNRTLDEYGVSAKDLRGFHANKFVIDKLKKEPISKDVKERAKQLKEAIKWAATKVGHGATTLRNQYMLPELEAMFIEKGKLIDLSDFYKTGGLVKMENGGVVDVERFTKSAAGVLLVAKKTGRVLLLRRGLACVEPDKWSMVSGGIESGESPEVAVKRELMEETGYVDDVNLKLANIYDAGSFGFYNYVGFINDEFVPVLNYENTDYKWVQLSDLPSPLHFGLLEFISAVDLAKIILLDNVVAYHGTRGFLPFERFEKNMIGTGLVSRGDKYGGFFFTTQKENAEFYTEYFICKVIINNVKNSPIERKQPPLVLSLALKNKENYIIKDVLDGSVFSDVIVVPETNLDTINIMEWEFIGDEDDVFEKWDDLFGGGDGFVNSDMINDVLKMINIDIDFLINIPIFKKYYDEKNKK
jgi:8-oxo-dGTP pyrophosphatase MutT (NUDIX family)